MKNFCVFSCGLLMVLTGVCTVTGNMQSTDEPSSKEFVFNGTDDQVAEIIRNVLVDNYLKDDLSFLAKSDRKFQLFQIDLNGDGEKEIFVRFFTSYFCGTGGCTFYLLDRHGNMITIFSVTRAPVYVDGKTANGWSILLVKDRGVFKALKYENGTYPANPSVLPDAPRNVPSEHAELIFHEDLDKAKTYSF